MELANHCQDAKAGVCTVSPIGDGEKDTHRDLHDTATHMMHAYQDSKRQNAIMPCADPTEDPTEVTASLTMEGGVAHTWQLLQVKVIRPDVDLTWSTSGPSFPDVYRFQ